MIMKIMMNIILILIYNHNIDNNMMGALYVEVPCLGGPSLWAYLSLFSLIFINILQNKEIAAYSEGAPNRGPQQIPMVV